MTPPAVLLAAELMGLDVVGIVDHSSAGNATAFLEAAPAFTPRVLVGLEVESSEGVHLLALFDQAAPALAFERVIQAHQPDLRNRAEFFGEQFLVDEWGEVVDIEPRLLAVATDLGVERVAELTLEYEGLSVAAHIDRPGNGLLSLLGLVPPRLASQLFEISRHKTRTEARERWPRLQGLPLVRGSDAHFLADIGVAPTRLPRDLARADLPVQQWAAELAAYLRTEGGPAHA